MQRKSRIKRRLRKKKRRGLLTSLRRNARKQNKPRNSDLLKSRGKRK